MTIMPGRFLLITFILGGMQSVHAHPSWLIAQNSPSAGQEVRSFFETGRLSSEDRLMFQTPPNGVIPPRETSNSWQFIIFKEGNVSFWVPPGVLAQENVVLGTTLGLVNFRTLASHNEDRHYMVAYADSITSEQRKDPLVIFQAIQDKIAPENEFKLTNQRPIKINTYPGEEWIFESAREMITMRVYLVDQRVYALGVRHPRSDSDSRSTRAFLNALELIDQ